MPVNQLSVLDVLKAAQDSGTGHLQIDANVPAASATTPGIVTTGTQTFAGDKTFTGTTTLASPITLGATSVTTTGTQLNYLNAATGTTGTMSTNVVFSGSPTIATPTISTITSANSTILTLKSSGTAGLVMDTNQFVAIGTGAISDGSIPFQVYGIGQVNGAARKVVKVFDTSPATTGTGGGISFGGWVDGTSSALDDFANIKGIKENSTAGNYSSALVFSTRADGGSPTEAMRLASTGVVTITNLAGSGSRAVNADAAGALSAASDSRLKTEVSAPLPGLKEILQIQPKAYKWNKDIEQRGEEAATEIGFFADHVAPIIPSAAPMGNDGYYGFYDRSVIAALVKSVQELKAEIDLLKSL